MIERFSICDALIVFERSPVSVLISSAADAVMVTLSVAAPMAISISIPLVSFGLRLMSVLTDFLKLDASTDMV